MNDSKRVGFVGLGNIGKPMADRLARANMPLTVFDTRPEQTRDAVAAGAVASPTLRDLASASDIVMIVVRTTEQVVEAIVGPDGVLAALAPGAIITVHSTMDRAALLKVAKTCADRGVRLLDAPVSGGELRAAEGTLTFMIGGDADDVDQCRSVIDILAGEIFHLGALGAGQAGKLVNNLMATIGIVAATEAMRLAEAAGIPEDTAAAMMRASSGNNNTLQEWEFWKAHIREEGAPERITDILQKDVSLALDMGREFGLDLPLSAAADARIAWAVNPSEHQKGPNSD